MESYVVISAEALDALSSSNLIAVEELIEKVQPRYYPDGSLVTVEASGYLTEQLQRVNVFEKLIAPTAFRSVSGFGEKYYALWYPSYYQDRLGDLSLNVVPRVATPVGPHERALASLPIAVSFKPRLANNMQREFLAALRNWQSSVNEVCQGKQVAIVDNTVTMGRNTAICSLDLRDTDHNSLLWLVLRIVEFGISKNTVDCIVCGQDDQISRFGITLETRIAFTF